MNTRFVLLGAVVCSIIGGVVTGLIYQNSRPVNDVRGLDIVQPDAQFVWTFHNDTVTNLQAFYKALSVQSGSAVFRRNLSLTPEKEKCAQPKDLEDAGWIWVSHPDPCKILPDMGQQVTQRVGFNNVENLKEALRYISPTPTPSPTPP
jgi:hypothetical protein